ncbi:FAD-dependent oxidoreductase [Aurantiacibacter zhengii]|nr:FAD-dependent oxidoreductase [Aurantiacibacter zhengii]
MTEQVPPAADLVVVGSGAAGLTAAITAASHGATVVVLEKSRWIGGTSAISGGGVWIPGSEVKGSTNGESAQNARQDQTALAYLQSVIGPDCDTRAIEEFLDQGPKAIRFLQEHTALKFAAREFSPDYYSELADATDTSRAIDSVELDGRSLGCDLALLRPPGLEATILGGMAVSGTDIARLRALSRSASAFVHSAKLVLRFAFQRLLHGRDTRLVLGQALIGRMLKSARALNVSIITDADVVDLDTTEGVICGVTALIGGEAYRIRARRGVVLAAGGFAMDQKTLSKWLPDIALRHAVGATENTGDGLKMGLAAGGTQDFSTDRETAYGVPVSHWQSREGTVITFPHFVTDRAKPGVIAVSPAGTRFVNEADSYHEFVRAMLGATRGPMSHAYLICDRKAMNHYGLGLARPWPFPRRHLLRDGYILMANTIEELAMRINVDPVALKHTIERYNSHAKKGEDKDFGKGRSSYNRSVGDPDVRPNPCIAPLQVSPFFALKLYPGNLGTSRGLKTDLSACVLDSYGEPIEGLYAAGNDADAIFRGNYPGPGTSLGLAITGGYIAGLHASGRAGT